MERDKIESIIESFLFVAGEPVSLKKMSALIPEAERPEVRAALEELIKKCDDPSRGVRVVEVAGGYQLQTLPENAPWVGKLMQTRPVRLSRASLETLAIVAYRQPVTRVEVDEVRGVDSGGVLKTLLEHGFVRIAGRKDVPGKPLIYATDKRFMEFFRLKTLGELPTLMELEEIQDQRLAEAASQGELPLDETEAGTADLSSPDPAREEDAPEDEPEDEEEPEGEGSYPEDTEQEDEET